VKSRRPNPSQIPTSESDSPPSAGHYDQEFLYHLYRGSELLQDNAVDEAKAELERALKLQPRDVEGQGLLGVVYFRLGLYPRAIEIYQQLQVAAPSEVAPRINLALCYLKTAQAELARGQLEEALRLAPEHQRAWGYLGLVFQRFGDFEKAKVAFERAGKPRMAQRMAELAKPGSDVEALFGVTEIRPDTTPPSLPPPSFRPSLMPALQLPSTQFPHKTASLRVPQPSEELVKLSAAEGATEALPPAVPADDLVAVRSTTSGLPSLLSGSTVGAQSLHSLRIAHPAVSVPAPLYTWARDAELVFPENPKLVLHPSGVLLVRVERSLVVRSSWIGGMSADRGSFQTHSLRRRTESRPGPSALVTLVGSGRVILHPEPGTHLSLFDTKADASLSVLEQRVVAFEPDLAYEVVPFDAAQEEGPSLLRIAGNGAVALFSHQPLQTVLVSPERPLLLRAGLVVGWLGALTSRVVPPIEAPAGLVGMTSFSGRGTVLVDASPRPVPTGPVSFGAGSLGSGGVGAVH
jgi:hypothetical protein